MTVDYKLIADGDPTGDLFVAYDTMLAQTETVSKGVFKVSDIMVAKEIGLTKANLFLDAVETFMPSRVANWIQGQGIDINDAETVAALGTITALVAEDLAAVLAMGTSTACIYGTGFKPGHLQNARQKREAGLI